MSTWNIDTLTAELKKRRLLRCRPHSAWLGQIVDFDARNFGVDAWASSTWAEALEAQWADFIAYIHLPPEVTFPQDLHALTTPVSIVALGGVSRGESSDILTIAVDEPHRGEGIASLLLEDLMQVARERGAREIFLEVRASHQRTQDFYHRHGFVPIALRKNYYSDDDALVMHRDA